jgi:hypothetical protein
LASDVEIARRLSAPSFGFLRTSEMRGESAKARSANVDDSGLR